MPSQKPFTYAEFKEIYSKVPRLSVDVIVRSKQGIALTLRSIVPYRDYWHIPGSTVLYRESAVQTARRVARDELGVSITAPKLLGYIEYNEEPHRDFGRSLSIVFLAELKSGTLTTDGDASKTAYFSRLPKKIIPVQKVFLKKHLPEIFSADLRIF
jgi:ADP-ribose pyrophosphatase YjhB (NUDIX family)